MATFTLNSRLTIAQFTPFRGVNEVSITKSIRNYNDKATVKLPASARYHHGGGTESAMTGKLIKRGDAIKIELGYNGEWRTEFEGFVARVSKAEPCVLECEGYAFLLHEKTINKSWRSVTLKAVLEEICSGTGIKVDTQIYELTLSNLSLPKMSAFDAIGATQKACTEGVSIWFVGKTIYAGLRFGYYTERNKSGKPDVLYKMGHNALRDGELKEKDGSDKYEIELYNKAKDGKRTKATVGVANSNSNRKRIQNIVDKKQLNRLGNEIEQKKNYQGLEGQINTFLVPYCEPGWKIKITDPRYGELDGNYLVEEVQTTFGTGGARRKIKPSVKLS